MRQIVLDTETTGLEVEQQHRVIEIGCVELVNRRLTGRSFHRYLNPERDIDEGAQQVHGLSREQLSTEPKFAHIHAEFLEFIRDAELIIHNAPFDVAFLNAEFGRLAVPAAATVATPAKITDFCEVLDTLALARKMHPGQRNSLDALCKRYSVDNSHREYHGALLDARILAEVYLVMTGGQAKFSLSEESETARSRAREAAAPRFAAGVRVTVVKASDEDLAAPEHALTLLDKASGGNTVWRKLAVDA
jgi:DNA polymerase-3 subunit epsilon